MYAPCNASNRVPVENEIVIIFFSEEELIFNFSRPKVVNSAFLPFYFHFGIFICVIIQFAYYPQIPRLN